MSGLDTILHTTPFESVSCAPPQGTAVTERSSPSDIGALIEGRGIYHGTWKPRPDGGIVHAYTDTDFLREASGRQVLLTWYETRDELARGNDGRRYADGSEAALHDALVKLPHTNGAYRDGDRVIGPQVLLNGVNNDGVKVRAGTNTYDLLLGSMGEVFNHIAKTLRYASSRDARWSWSSSAYRDGSSSVRAVSLSGSYGAWKLKVYDRLGVLPFRFFREPHAAKAVSRLAL